MTSAIEINAMSPTQEQMKAFLALPESPVVMINLLKFKADGGAEEYAKYGVAIQPCLAKVGAKLLFSGQALSCLIGYGDWDMVALMEYPNPGALIEMVNTEEYQAAHVHREAGLEGQINYAVVQNPSG